MEGSAGMPCIFEPRAYWKSTTFSHTKVYSINQCQVIQWMKDREMHSSTVTFPEFVAAYSHLFKDEDPDIPVGDLSKSNARVRFNKTKKHVEMDMTENHDDAIGTSS